MKNVLFMAILAGCPAVVCAQMDYRLYGISLDNGDLFEIDKTTGQTTKVMNLGFVPNLKHGFDFDPSGNALCVTRPVYGYTTSERVRINLSAKTTALFGNRGPVESTEGLGFTNDGNAFVFDDRPSPGRGVLDYCNFSDSSSGQIMEYTGAQLIDVTGGDYEESTSTFWAADSYFSRIYGLNTTTGSVSFQSQVFSGACCDVDVTTTGDILVSVVASGVTQILKLNRSTGELIPFLTTPLSTNLKIASVPFLHDRDGDGLGDDVETNTGVFLSVGNTGTDPDKSDTDGDGLDDGREIKTAGTNPLLRDSDGDHFDDGFELSTGFLPLDSTSTPDTWSTIHTAVEFRFASATGQTYKVEASSDLGTWEVIDSGIPGTGSFIQRFYSIQNTPRRYFRATKE